MLKRVPTVRTNFTIADFIKSLVRAWYDLYRVLPKKSQVAVLYAQWGLETGLGTYCWNFNTGNIKAVDVPGVVVEYCVLSGVWEIVNGRKVFLSPENPGSWFRAFPTLDAGVDYHMSFLRNKRYKIAWTAVEQGDPVQFAKLLKQQGYYTAAEADYIKAMQYHFVRFMADSIYESALQDVINELNIVNFPDDYKPIDMQTFNVVDDSFTRKEKMASKNLLYRWAIKIKNIFN